jgi:hypothetical protein
MNLRARVPDSGDVIKYFQNDFDSIYAVLHPFIKVEPEYQNLFDPSSDDKPTRAQLKAIAHSFSWHSVLELTSISTIQCLNRLLLEGIGAVTIEHPQEVRVLREQLKHNNILEPREGNFPKLLLDDFLHSFTDWGYEAVYVGNEFGDRATLYQVSDLFKWEYPNVGEHCPTLYSEDFGLLYGVHWDSFYTFLCGVKEIVSEIVNKYSFEGFFFEPGMQVYWGK